MADLVTIPSRVAVSPVAYWIRRIRRGLVLYVIGMVLFVALFVIAGAMGLELMEFAWLIPLVSLPVSIGSWLVGAPEPNDFTTRYFTARKIIRGVAVVGLGGDLVAACFALAVKSRFAGLAKDEIIITGVFGVRLIGILGHGAQSLYLARLAQRIGGWVLGLCYRIIMCALTSSMTLMFVILFFEMWTIQRLIGSRYFDIFQIAINILGFAFLGIGAVYLVLMIVMAVRLGKPMSLNMLESTPARGFEPLMDQPSPAMIEVSDKTQR